MLLLPHDPAVGNLLRSPYLLWAGVEMQLHQKREVVQGRLRFSGELPDHAFTETSQDVKIHDKLQQHIQTTILLVM